MAGALKGADNAVAITLGTGVGGGIIIDHKIYSGSNFAGAELGHTVIVVDGRPCFHVSLVVDVSPNCDCHAENDVPIVPDVGMFASFDPVALDQACADAVLAQTPAPNSALFDEGCDCSSGDYFHAAHPDTDWAVCLEHAEKIGIGTRAYELIKI